MNPKIQAALDALDVVMREDPNGFAAAFREHVRTRLYGDLIAANVLSSVNDVFADVVKAEQERGFIVGLAYAATRANRISKRFHEVSLHEPGPYVDLALTFERFAQKMTELAEKKTTALRESEAIAAAGATNQKGPVN